MPYLASGVLIGPSMKLVLPALAALVLPSVLAACSETPAIEDGENDEFFTGDAKADAFGVEDWSPDGAAGLTLASSMSAAKLEDDVGLSARVAKAIVTQR